MPATDPSSTGSSGTRTAPLPDEAAVVARAQAGDRTAFAHADLEQAQEMMRAAVPAGDIAFLKGFEDMIAIGDYLFVHAGIDPAVPIGEQKVHDLRWIREPFLSHPEPYDQVVVHGHTISEAPEDCGNRIGIDTGAFMTGRLTALVLEGRQRRYIEAERIEGGVVTVAPLVV